jgi:hypothetical protein
MATRSPTKKFLKMKAVVALVCAVTIVAIIANGYLWMQSERTHVSLVNVFNGHVNDFVADFPEWSALTWTWNTVQLDGVDTEPPAAVGWLVYPYQTYKYSTRSAVVLGTYVRPMEGDNGHGPNITVQLSSPNNTEASLTIAAWILENGTLNVLSDACLLANVSGHCGVKYTPRPSIAPGEAFDVVVSLTCRSPLDPILFNADFEVPRTSAIATSILAVLATITFAILLVVGRHSDKISPLFVVGVVALLSHAVTLEGIFLLDHWSWQLVCQPIGFAGLLIVIGGSSVALPCSLICCNHVIAQATNENKSRLGFLFSLACGLICVLALVFLLKPWASPGTDPWSQDPCSALIGAFFMAVYGLFGVSYLIAALGLRQVSGPQHGVSLNVISSDFDGESESLLSGENRMAHHSEKEISPAARRQGWLLGFAFSIFSLSCVFASLVLPPHWNHPVADYLAFVTPDGWNVILNDGALVLKLYGDVITYYCFLAVFILICFVSALSKNFRTLLQQSNAGHFFLLTGLVALVGVWIWYWMFDVSRLFVSSFLL